MAVAPSLCPPSLIRALPGHSGRMVCEHVPFDPSLSSKGEAGIEGAWLPCPHPNLLPESLCRAGTQEGWCKKGATAMFPLIPTSPLLARLGLKGSWPPRPSLATLPEQSCGAGMPREGQWGQCPLPIKMHPGQSPRPCYAPGLLVHASAFFSMLAHSCLLKAGCGGNGHPLSLASSTR